MTRALFVGVTVVAATPAAAWAHSADAPASWLEPIPLISLFLAAAWVYARGLRRLGPRWPRRWTAAAIAGAAVTAAALLSPLDRLASTSVTAHMAQHTLLIVVAAPLIALGRPLAVAAAALPAWRLRPALAAPRPGLAAAAHAVALWLWHLPPLYDVALARPVVHAVAHATLLGTAVYLWWSVGHGRARVVGALWLFVTAVHAGALGALLALSPRPWFRGTELADQQLAGLLMWVPAGGVLTAIALALLGGWLRAGARLTSRAATRPG
jgi:putative membrane protein